MKLTNATENALAVVAMLATQSGNKPIPSSVIVKHLGISDSYTKKLLRRLVVAKVIISTPGNSGGFKLNRELKAINVLEIVEAIEGPINTYYGYEKLGKVFTKPIGEPAKSDNVVKQAFNQADHLWRTCLTKKSVDDLIVEAFGEEEVVVNWLDVVQ